MLLYVVLSFFGALTVLVGRQEEHSACKTCAIFSKKDLLRNKRRKENGENRLTKVHLGNDR